MTGEAIESLEGLLRALGKQRSLRGRLRVLGHSWQLLRSLSPSDREKVALRMGSSWAWKRLEKSFMADGELSETERTVGRVFERMGAADPRELRSLASSIRRGDRQAGKDLLLMTLTEALEEEAEEDAAIEAEPVAPGAPEVPEDSGVQRPRPTPSRAAPARDEDTSEAAAASTEPPTERRPEASPPDPPRPITPPPIAVIPEARPPVEPESSVPSNDFGASEELGELPDDFGEPAATTGTERLRILRSLQRAARPGADLGRAGRARLLESLGGGWATRRALSRMIARHSLDDVDEALALIAELDRSGQRTWCLSDLIEHWALDDGAEQRILDAAPTDAARRRLGHRLS